MFDKSKQTSTPTINEPSSSQPSSSRHQSSGSISDQHQQRNRLSVSGERGRSTSTTTAGARAGSVSRSRSRKRDVFWKSSLFDSSNQQGPSPKDGSVRAKSLSVNKVHPTVMEEHMKATDWSRRRA